MNDNILGLIIVLVLFFVLVINKKLKTKQSFKDALIGQMKDEKKSAKRLASIYLYLTKTWILLLMILVILTIFAFCIYEYLFRY